MPGCVESSVPPCIFPVYGGLRPNMLIHISGKPIENAQRFSVNLQRGRDPVPSDIALRIEVCFATSRVIRNSRHDGTWDQEETYFGNFPFQPGESFSIVITTMMDRFHIVINRQHAVQFPYRVSDLKRMDTVYIDKDAVITSIRWVGSA